MNWFFVKLLGGFMKRSFLILFALLSFTTIAFVGCWNHSDPVRPESDDMLLTVTIPDESEIAIQSDFNECSMEKPAYLLIPKNDPLYPERPVKYMTPLGRILRELNLDSLQKEQVRNFLAEYRDCVKNALQTLRESEKQIIQTANDQRQQVLQDLKNNVIDRGEAYRRLMEINHEIRQALINNPVRQQVLQQLKDCFTTLINNIRNILTDDQKALFDELIQRYRDKRNGGKYRGPRP